MSDILIKGMEMPVTCSYCPLIAYDPDIEWNDGGRETQGAYVCVITHELIDNTKREDHCPLVPVPPHGRLIDADAALRDGWTISRTYSASQTEMVYEVKAIDCLPAVIEAEEGET